VTLPKHSLAEDVSAATVAVLAPQLPGADPERLAAQIEALKLLPAHARGLLAHLQAHPDALASGEATGPSALRALLDVLATEHPAVQRVRCHRCGAQRRLPYRRGGASICGRCYAQTHLKVCVRCGELGRPDSREDGGVVCLRCKV
jgi:recombinational DNA repair protein (RecF pathway)